MASIDLPDDTYLALKNFMDKIRPYASRFGGVVTEVSAIDEALAVADGMWSDKGYVDARMKEPSERMKKSRSQFKRNLK